MQHTTWQAKELTPGQLSERSGVAVSALHFYEREGLIASRRTSGNQRRYSRETLRRVAFIRISQRVGIPLSEIRKALDTLPEGRTPNRKDWERLSVTWRADLDQRIEQLTRLRNSLTDCIGCGCLSLGSCRIVNYHDRLGNEGPGARTLDVSIDCTRDDGCEEPAGREEITPAGREEITADADVAGCAEKMCG
ncbi:redox-sensitive transcriptional activator SoxR [Nocardia africana]|uniref:Redox-sensitive transcriptional activator soxR n=1 Tax=Nocardia africana TaxID=134964 RepID=A0A378X4K2_9NOCA|nr:redox-sensitive transcriptional activator SoxR [Nocardia africana]MCC3317215.1 redox-sensitive transcriptional activator SoxR [Nocardia africana]SUA47947.1 Redox-sensitive transcriptional activator soxR [Nocardia africana]